jgi:hypothetical protein
MAKRKYDYQVLLNLNHDELAAKINNETGEIIPYVKQPNNIPSNKIVFEPSAMFSKTYNNTWNFITNEFSHIEVVATINLILISKMNTNSLIPLTDKTTIKELSVILKISINRVTKVINKLFEYGVFGRFEVVKPNVEYTKYWILNPFLGFRGKIIDVEIIHLFEGTHIHKAFLDPNYKLK